LIHVEIFYVTVCAILIFSGAIKGVSGMGLQTFAMGFLSLLMAPVEAASLLILPAFITNLWQLFSGPYFGLLIKRLWVFLFFIFLGTLIGVSFLTASHSRWPGLALGVTLASYAAISLFSPQFSMSHQREKKWGPGVGWITGLITGATGIFVVPAVPFIGSLELTKDEMIQALGLSFTISTLSLAVGLGFSVQWVQADVLFSALAVVPSLFGMYLGQKFRGAMSPVFFRKVFFVILLFLGLYMFFYNIKN
jgi:hypothetical protein